MYYGIILFAVALFGFQFYFNGLYQKEAGSSLFSSFFLSCTSGVVGAISLSVLNGISFSTTPFTIIMAFLNALIGLAFTFFAIKALGKINLSLFSVFSMLGGMVLPFVAGIIFYKEPLTVAKIICFCLIVLALGFTVDRNTKDKKGSIYYIGVFILNGMAAVLSMIYSNSSFEKESANAYSFQTAVIRVLIALIVIVLLKKPSLKMQVVHTKKMWVAIVFCGFLGTIANYLLLIALKHIQGSIQYSLVTGGVMIASTLIGFFTDKKPTVKNIVSVVVSTLAMLSLLLPI